MIEQTRPYVAEGRLQVITICDDTEEDCVNINGRPVHRFRQIIDRYNITCPVVYDGGQGNPEHSDLSIPATEWSLRYVPASFLISPSGVIVARDFGGDSLVPTLDYFLDHNRPIIGLRGSLTVNDDGTLSILAEVMNAGRQSVEVILDYHWENWQYDADDPEMPITKIDRRDERAYGQAIITFDEFSENVHEFVVEMNGQAQLVGYHLSMLMPDTQGILAPDSPGIEIRYDKYVALMRDIQAVDGIWHYSPGVREMDY